MFESQTWVDFSKDVEKKKRNIKLMFPYQSYLRTVIKLEWLVVSLLQNL